MKFLKEVEKNIKEKLPELNFDMKSDGIFVGEEKVFDYLETHESGIKFDTLTQLAEHVAERVYEKVSNKI